MIGQLKISLQLKDALQDYESFLSYVQAYGAWARSDPDRPCNYKCPIKYQSGYPEPKAMQISEEDALAIDAAFAEYTKANRMNKLLFEIIIVCFKSIDFLSHRLKFCLVSLFYSNRFWSLLYFFEIL